MTSKKTEDIVHFLKGNGISFDEAITDNEFSTLEKKFSLIFPPDLKDLLSIALPVTPYFPNWRTLLDGSDSYIKESITHPEEGILFDIEVNNFWYSAWGEKPKEISDALELAKKELKKVPKLVRVFGHRYIPSEPLEKGNPIFSISQTDIVYYGHDLESYFHNEFNPGYDKLTGGYKLNIDRQKIKKIPFWSDLAF
jgi:hypothetical protein